MRALLVVGLLIGACGGDDDGVADRPDAMPEIDAEPPPTSCDPAIRETRDRADEAGEYQIHVVYALPSDGVTFVRLSNTDAFIASRGAYVRNEIEAFMRTHDLIADDKIYAVYYDGSSTYACGGGAWPPTLNGQVGALYLRGAPPGSPTCDSIPFAGPGDPPGYHEFGMLHEIIHTLGMVAEAAPHHNLSGHVGDTPSDLMYAGSSPWDPSVLDLGHDDYYGHGQAWPDLARSAFLDPRPADAELPPGW